MGKSTVLQYVSAGTYYLKISRNDHYIYNTTGKYELRVYSDYTPLPPSVNTVSNKSKQITDKTIANGTVTVKINSKKYTGKSDSKGNFKISIPKQSAGTKIYVSVTNSDGLTSSAHVVTVVDKIPPEKPKVKSVKSTSISGTCEKDSIVYAYVGSKKIGSDRANSKGNYKITFKKQKSGIKITIFAKDKAGNKSKSVTVKAK